MKLSAVALFGKHPSGKQADVWHPSRTLPSVMAAPAPQAGEIANMDGSVTTFEAGDYLVTAIPPTDLRVVPKAFFEEHWRKADG